MLLEPVESWRLLLQLQGSCWYRWAHPRASRHSVMVLRWMNSLAPRTGSHHLSPVSEATATPLASPLPTPQPEGHQVTPTICSGPRSGPCTGSGTQTCDSGGDGSLSCTRGSQGTRRQNPPGTQALSLVHAQRQGEFCRQLPQEVPSRGETRACLQGPHGEG